MVFEEIGFVHPTYSNLYAYAANNPVYYTDPDGNFLVNNTEHMEDIALSNKNFMFQTMHSAWAQASDGKLYPAYVNYIKIKLPTNLDKLIDNIQQERANPSAFVKTNIIATCEKIDNDIYKINITAVLTEHTKDGEITVSESGTVAYATALEIEITPFNIKGNQKAIDDIANQVLYYAGKGVVVDEQK